MGQPSPQRWLFYLLRFTPSSILEASREYLKEIPNATPEVARLDVVSERKWKAKMYNASVPREESARAIKKLYEKYLDENKAYKDDGFRSYFRKVTPKAQSTKEEIDNLVSHVLRGDYKDPFPPQQMSFVRR
jgi:hypothetical protein